MTDPTSKSSQTQRRSLPATAPGDLEILQSLLNTWKPSQAEDALRSSRAVASWLSRWRLMPATTELTADDVRRIVFVREGLRAHLRTHTGAAPDEVAAARLENATVGARIEVRVDRDGTARFEPASQSFSDTVGLLLGMVVTAQREGLWARFKVCANPACRAAFYDSAPRANGKWCSRRCGDLIRARRHRLKHGD